MNLYIVGWNFPNSRFPRAIEKLSEMIEVYPQLDPETLWHYQSPSGSLFMASMHTSNEAAAPRCYVHQNENEVVVYSGLPVDPEGTNPAHRAEELSTHWDSLVENLEGEFALLRANRKTESLELVTDVCGFERVFYREWENSWLISNSVGLIERVTEPCSFDPVGLSLFLSTGDVVDHRTIREGIRIVPGGQHWEWNKADADPKKISYFLPSSLVRKEYVPPTPVFIEELSEKMLKPIRSLARYFDPIKCSLTGGRDSRLIAALLNHAGISAQYYTAGNPASDDVRVASELAKKFGLQHEVSTVDSEDVLDDWDNLVKRYLLQNEGLISIWQVADILTQNRPFKRLDLYLWGAGGEIGRSYHGQPELFIGKKSLEDIQTYLKKNIVHSRGGLIRPEAMSLAHSFYDGFAAQYVNEGFSPLDIPDLEIMLAGTLNWFGNTARTSVMISDLYSPYFSRAFLNAVSSLSPQQRYTEPLHYNVILHLAPEMHRFPFEKESWRPQQPTINLLYKYGSMKINELREGAPSLLRKVKKKIAPEQNKVPSFDKMSWIETKLSYLREMCLDQSASVLWEYVDRDVFESVYSPTSISEITFKQKLKLYVISTAFYNEEIRAGIFG